MPLLNSLLGRSSIYFLSNVINALIPFLLIPVLTRYLEPQEYGQLAMFQTLIAGLAAFTGLSVHGAANRKYYDKVEKKQLAIFNGACIQILTISVIMLLFVVFLSTSHLATWLNIPVSWVYFALLISSANFVIQFRLGQWQIRECVIRYGFLQVLQSVLVFCLSIYLVVYLSQGAKGRVEAYVIASVGFMAFCIASLYKDKLLNIFLVDVESYKEALSFGVPLVPHIVGMFFLSSIDRFVINDRLGVSEAGIYMLAVQLSQGMVIVFDAINKALVPWLFRSLADNQSEQLKKLVHFTYIYFFVVGFLGLLAFWIGPWVVSLVAGEQYLRATSVIGWLCLGQAFSGMYLMVTNYLFYAKKTGRLSLLTISCGVLNVALLLHLLPTYGIVGVAMSFALAMAMRFLGTWWLASHVISFKIF